jgi:hypothetical protein
MKDRGLQLGREKRLPLVGVTRGWNVRWGRASFLQFFIFLAYRGEDASGQGHGPLYYFWILQKQGGWDHGAELNFRLFQARFLIRLSAKIDR